MKRRTLCTAWTAWLPMASAWAHDFRAGALRVDHPYAVPTLKGSNTGAVYFRALKNPTDAPDRLLGAHTPVAGSVELHQMQIDGGVMRMRAVDAFELPARGALVLRPGGPHHLMLQSLKQPLTEGDRFALTLRFERAGEHTVKVWVQTPRAATGQDGATTAAGHPPGHAAGH